MSQRGDSGTPVHVISGPCLCIAVTTHTVDEHELDDTRYDLHKGDGAPGPIVRDLCSRPSNPSNNYTSVSNARPAHLHQD